jgi:4-diphosphocytidyl-2-C-methyl-D-erythritol kinase
MPAMAVEALAPAKVNLFLHVGPRGADGYHPIRSLVMFADIGDRLTLAPAPGFDFVIDGEFAEGLSAGVDNLVIKAREALLAAARRPCPAFRLTLTKALPLASGLGGGTSDAAAALRLINAAVGLECGEEVLAKIAATLGADGPACLRGRTVIVEGRGEALREAPFMPLLDAVLVNPRVPSPTAGVYAAFDRLETARPLGEPALPPGWRSPTEVAEFLRSSRNDLEAPAMTLAPVIAEVLGLLAGRKEALITRLSGSGATVFALCADAAAARRLAAEVGRLRPTWWVRPCRLGDRPQA